MVEAQLDGSVLRTSACTPTPRGYFSQQSESRRKGQNHVTVPKRVGFFAERKGSSLLVGKGHNFLYSLSLFSFFRPFSNADF